MEEIKLGEIFDQDPSIADELWARAVAGEVLRFARTAGAEEMAARVDSGAVRALSEIKQALDDPSLDDPACFYRIDAIVDAFYRAGLSTRRHQDCE